MKRVQVFFHYSTSAVWNPQPVDVTVEYEGVFDKKFEEIKKTAAELVEKKIGKHKAIITGMVHRTSVY